jgi:hypothetical protein
VDTNDRKIGLSLKRAKWGDAEMAAGKGGDGGHDADVPDLPTRGGMDDHGALGTDKIEL